MPKRPGFISVTYEDGKKIYNIIKSKIPYKTYVVGSIRREKDIINDIDILIVINDSQYDLYPIISKILYKIERNGKRIISGIYLHNNNKILVDFFISSNKELPYAMLQYTGPKSYNIRIRKYVKDQYGWLLNQYGLYYANRPHVKVSKSNEIRTEKELIKFIGTTYYHPYERK